MMKYPICLLIIIFLKFSIAVAGTVATDATISWSLTLQKIESFCNKGDYNAAFNVLTKTYAQYKFIQKDFETYNTLTIYNSIRFFNDDYRQHKFFADLKDEITDILPPLLQREISEGVAIELIKFWYFSGNKKRAFDFGKNIEKQNIKFIHGKSFIYSFSFYDILDFEIKNGNSFNALRVLNHLFVYTEEVSLSAYIKMLFSILYLKVN